MDGQTGRQTDATTLRLLRERNVVLFDVKANEIRSCHLFVQNDIYERY
jgi:hypothetical protein